MKNKDQETRWHQLMVAAQKGDGKAYHRLLTEITPPLRGFIGKRLFDEHAVEDVVQDILLGLHRVRHTYNAEQPFTSWLFAIARYKLIDTMRKHGRQHLRRGPSLNDDLTHWHETIADPTAKTETGALHHDLNKALKGLPTQQQRVVVMLKVAGLSVEQVAKRLHMSPSAVKVSAHRAYKKMRTYLND